MTLVARLLACVRVDETGFSLWLVIVGLVEDTVTLDGFTPSIMANIGKPEDVEALNKVGAQGVGLLRTEFLFLNREIP